MFFPLARTTFNGQTRENETDMVTNKVGKVGGLIATTGIIVVPNLGARVIQRWAQAQCAADLDPRYPGWDFWKNRRGDPVPGPGCTYRWRRRRVTEALDAIYLAEIRARFAEQGFGGSPGVFVHLTSEIVGALGGGNYVTVPDDPRCYVDRATGVLHVPTARFNGRERRIGLTPMRTVWCEAWDIFAFRREDY